MPSIDKKKVGLVYSDQYSKYENLSTVSDSSIFLIKDSGVYVGQNLIANYVDTNLLLSVADASLRYQPKANYALKSYVDETFSRKPVIIYETDGTTGLLGVNANTLSANNWQLQSLDLTPYSYIKCYFKISDFSASSVYLTPAMVVVVPLDEASLSKAVGDASPSGKVPCDMYIGGNTATNPNDPDVHIAMIVAVSNDKTKLQVVQQNSIAGTINGDRNNNGRYLYKIEGYYEDPSEAISGSTPTPVVETDPTVPSYVKSITEIDISTWNHKVDPSSLAEVAFNGSYDYLQDRPTIPTKLSDLINDAGYAYDASVMNLNKVPYVTDTAAANVTIEPYKMYDFGTVSTSMVIAFDTTKEITGYTKEYIIRFTAETGCAVSLPNGVLYANGTIPTYIAGHIYEINIVNGCAVVAEFY